MTKAYRNGILHFILSMSGNRVFARNTSTFRDNWYPASEFKGITVNQLDHVPADRGFKTYTKSKFDRFKRR